MLKKIYSFQKLLLLNIQYPFGNSTMEHKFNDLDKYATLILFFIGIAYLLFLDGSLIFLFITMVVLTAISSFLSYNNDIIETIPASKLFVIFNLYLSGILLFIVCFLVLALPNLLMENIYLLILFCTGNLSNSSSTTLPTGFESETLILLITLIFYFVMLTIMFIRKQNLRYALAIGFSSGYFIILLCFKRIVSVNKNLIETNDMLSNFQSMPNKSTILIYWILAFIILVVASIFTSYYLYRGKRTGYLG
ncbi:MAG TPA: hypothetical protein VIK72_07190 [Clostridiaceae bacterium]